MFFALNAPIGYMKLEFNITAKLVGQQILQTHRLNIADHGWDSGMIFGKYFTEAYFLRK